MVPIQSHFTWIDWIVLVGYFVTLMYVGYYFWRKSQSSEEFTVGGRSIPGWLCGLSIFATYLSSISFLALPGKAFVENWNAFLFSLAVPVAAVFAILFFIPLYRGSNEVSAYALLEKRFGPWARIYASGFYLLFQIARSGFVMYLMALPMAVIFGWDIRLVIMITGIVVTAYAFLGGITAVIWADAIQALILLFGALLALKYILAGLPHGVGDVVDIAIENEKFSLGSVNPLKVSQPTIWIVLLYGLFENLKNFGIDQSYIQRYMASESDVAAKRGLWLSAGLYIPVSMLFFFIGTSLFAYYTVHPQEQQEVTRLVARQKLMQEGVPPEYVGEQNGSNPRAYSLEYQKAIKDKSNSISPKDTGDRVFPHFIAAHLPAGVTGLLIAAIFSAAMSTVSTSLNSSATLVMSDFYQRFLKPKANDKQLMRVLHVSTVLWGLMGTVVALLLVRLSETALDSWWTISSILGAGILGVFLLAVIHTGISIRAAVTSVVLGTVMIAWMVLSKTELWPKSLESIASPFHNYLIIVLGPTVIVLVGLIFRRMRNAKRATTEQAGDES